MHALSSCIVRLQRPCTGHVAAAICSALRMFDWEWNIVFWFSDLPLGCFYRIAGFFRSHYPISRVPNAWRIPEFEHSQ
jgi:hypothetical protein